MSTTYKQQIKLLKEQIQKLEQTILNLKHSKDELVQQTNTVSKTDYDILNSKYLNIQTKLKSFNLWTGE